MQVRFYFEQETQSNIFWVLAMFAMDPCKSNHLYTDKRIYLMVDQERKWCHFRFKAICGAKGLVGRSI